MKRAGSGFKQCIVRCEIAGQAHATDSSALPTVLESGELVSPDIQNEDDSRLSER